MTNHSSVTFLPVHQQLQASDTEKTLTATRTKSIRIKHLLLCDSIVQILFASFPSHSEEAIHDKIICEDIKIHIKTNLIRRQNRSGANYVLYWCACRGREAEMKQCYIKSMELAFLPFVLSFKVLARL